MNHIVSFLTGFLTLAAAVSAGPERLKTFEEILASLKAGSMDRVVLHYKDMTLFDDQGEKVGNVPEAVGGMDLSAFEYFAAGSIGNQEGYFASSATHLIDHPRYGFVVNDVKISVYESGKVSIKAKYLSPTEDSVRMDETFATEINDGKNGAGARFYLTGGKSSGTDPDPR